MGTFFIGTVASESTSGTEDVNLVDVQYKVIPVSYDAQTNSWSALLGYVLASIDSWEPFSGYSNAVGSQKKMTTNEIFRSSGSGKNDLKKYFGNLGLNISDESLKNAELYAARGGRNYVFIVTPKISEAVLQKNIKHNYDEKLAMAKEGKFLMEEVHPLLHVLWIPVQEIINSINNPNKTWGSGEAYHKINTRFKNDLKKLWQTESVQENLKLQK